MRRANLFSISPGVPFLPAFVDALLDGQIIDGFPKRDPFVLASATIYTPTRRAGRSLSRLFAQKNGGASLLPRIVPLGQTEEIETALSFDGDPLEVENSLATAPPPAIDEIERRLALAQLILVWGRSIRRSHDAGKDSGDEPVPDSEGFPVAATPAKAMSLARDLSSLIDEFIIEDVSWNALDAIVPEAFDHYWGLTLDFLKIARDHWPLILQSRGRMEAAARRAELIEREVERLAGGTGPGPVIAIGSTGTNKATARLLNAIAHAKNGAVVLPGLDFSLDPVVWTLLGDPSKDPSVAGHPQSALRRLMTLLSVERTDVQEIGLRPKALDQRARFLSEALLPAEATHCWRRFDRSELPLALDKITLIEAADEREEALALAIRIREALETPDLIIALMTPSRAIAARVRAELKRWGIEVEDSAGEPLADSLSGVLARLILKAALDQDFGVDSLALLAHQYTLFGFTRQRIAVIAEAADVALARTSIMQPRDLMKRAQAACLAAGEEHAHPALKTISDDEWLDLETLLQRLDDALSPLRRLAKGARLADWSRAHAHALAQIAGAPRPSEDDRLLNALLDRLEEHASDDTIIFDALDYLDLFENLTREIAVRDRQEGHPRLSILGLLEARLMSFDLILLAGMDETIWPPSVETGPFLNRPMREALGMTPPERRIGQTAHDFVQAMGAHVVVLSRAKKRGGAPTTPSRFLQRMEALAREGWDAVAARGDAWLRIADRLEFAPPSPPIDGPKPRPAIELRPRRLSVTRIETLRRDPYAIYAEFILKLKPLPPTGRADAARSSGEELHGALADFVQRYPKGALPPDSEKNLKEIAIDLLGPMFDDIAWRAFYWPRLERSLSAFIRWEQERRLLLQQTFVEQKGAIRIPLFDGSDFMLTAIADRLDKRTDGTFSIIDYKSGRAPSAAEISCGFAPQLTLEAIILRQGGFDCARTSNFATHGSYLSFAGGELKEISAVKTKDPADRFQNLADEHYRGLIALLSQFRNAETPYISRPFPQFASRFAEYDHLARVKEWSAASEGEEGQ